MLKSFEVCMNYQCKCPKKVGNLSPPPPPNESLNGKCDSYQSRQEHFHLELLELQGLFWY